MTRIEAACAFAFLCQLVMSAVLAADENGIAWETLSETQQSVLGTMRGSWDELDAARQRRLAAGAESWSAMSAEQRQQARQRLKRWKSLAPERRAQLSQRLERFKALSLEKRQRLRRTFDRFKSLPQEKRRELRNKWRSMSPDARREALRNHRQRREAGRTMDSERQRAPRDQNRFPDGRNGDFKSPQRQPRNQPPTEGAPR